MKITGFSPIIVSKEPEKLIELFEDLGFEKAHLKTGIENGANETTTLKDENGNRINIASTKVDRQDITAVNINVDNFEEAYDLFISHGFVNPRGDKVTDTGSSKATMLFAPSGAAVNLVEHIKD